MYVIRIFISWILCFQYCIIWWKIYFAKVTKSISSDSKHYFILFNFDHICNGDSTHRNEDNNYDNFDNNNKEEDKENDDDNDSSDNVGYGASLGGPLCDINNPFSGLKNQWVFTFGVLIVL